MGSNDRLFQGGILFVSVVALGVLSGCGADKPECACPKTPTAPLAASGAAEAKPAVAASNAPKGLLAKDNDADVVKLVTKVIECRKQRNCDTPQDWYSSGELWEGGAADATLVNLVEDPDPQVRAMAAGKLYDNYRWKRGSKVKRGYPADAKLSGRLLSALEGEANEQAAQALGGAVGGINFEATGLGDRAWGAYEKLKLPAARGEFLTSVARNYPEDAKVIARVESAASDNEPQVRASAVSAVDLGNDSPPGVCDFWNKILDGKDDDLADNALQHLARASCSDPIKVLEAIAARPKTSVWNIESVCTRDNLPDAARNRASEIAQQRATQKGDHNGWERSQALGTLARCDAKKGKALATKLASDPDKTVAEAAKGILAPKKK